MNHHAVQNALVRMLYDPRFAEAVRAAPATSGLPAEVARAVAAIDPRALLADPLRARRTLGTLVEEFKVASTLAAVESRSLALLEGFFSSDAFHHSVESRTPLALAWGDYLLLLCSTGQLSNPRLPDVVKLEAMQARARREAAPVDKGGGTNFVQLAPGVRFGRFGAEVLDTVQRVEQFLFERSILPPLSLCDDAPRLSLPPPDPALPPLCLLTVPLASGLTLVTVDDELRAVVEPLSSAPMSREAIVSLAASVLGPPSGADRAAALVGELLEDEILSPVPRREIPKEAP